MKIALVDNMNNNFFAFARYLKNVNIDVHLYTIPNHHIKHFEPSADTFNNINNITWIHKFPTEINNKSWLFFKKELIKKEFICYDLIISCGLSSAYLYRAGLKSHIIIPYGSDLYDIPFRQFKVTFNINIIRSLLWENQAMYQKLAYNNCDLLVVDDKYELYEDALNKLGLTATNPGIPMLYTKEELNHPSNSNLWSYLDSYDFIVFNHSRQLWKSDNYPGLKDFKKYGGIKRNDKIIKAFAKFIQTTHFKAPLLVLFEYGLDFNETKQLIKTLDIEKYVKWMPTMNRKHIMYGLKKATFSSNAFRVNKTDIGGVCYESLATGTLHLNNCIEAIENPKHKFYKSPMIHALSEDDLLNIFIDYEKNPQKYQEIRKKSIEWFDENLGFGLAKKYIKIINSLVNNQTLIRKNKSSRDTLES